MPNMGEALFFKCPKCGSLFSTSKSIMEQDRYIKSILTRPLFGGKLSPLAYVPNCTQCSTKLERISSEEFEQQSSRFSPEK
jgi:DNA-directed RNA polymerase subunit RPC12/RpoP